MKNQTEKETIHKLYTKRMKNERITQIRVAYRCVAHRLIRNN